MSLASFPSLASVTSLVWLDWSPDPSQPDRSTGFSSTLRSTSSTLVTASVLLLASVNVSEPAAASEAETA